MVAVHRVASLFVAVSTFAIFCLVGGFAGRSEALLAALLFLLLSTDPRMQGTAANSELFMALPVLLAHWLFLAEPLERRWTWLRVGALLGLASAYK
ncbi:MAG: glycosyltransferase family 39 protein, partial [Myxococcota bacterium]